MTQETISALKEAIRKLPNNPGVYVMYNRFKQALYVGKAKNLKKRVSSYFHASKKLQITQPKIRAMVEQIESFECHCVNSESEALLLESQFIKKFKPKYNTSLKDDKRFLLVQLNPKETLPRFRLTRNRIYKHFRYYGPFPHAGSLRKTLDIMKRKFGILLNDASPKKIGENIWQLYDDMRADLSDLPNEISEEAYNERVEKACGFLEGHTLSTIDGLKERMHAYARMHKYEKASELRDQIIAIQQTSKRTRKFERNLIGFITEKESLMTLSNELSLSKMPKHIECFDISHISGSFCVASMICFNNGKPNRKQYRRYKIKSFIGNDDCRAIEEVVTRRYRRLQKEGNPFPDLIVIDGGIGQVHAAIKAFQILKLNPPYLIGLAKKNETIVFPDNRPDLNLPFRNPALRLLQYLRDEAHYFANNFNAELRSKKIKESILDDFRGIGEIRKAKLLKRFGTIRNLKRATIEDLIKEEGIGLKTAKELSQFLEQN
ncbi:excinuclease ABC subunit UvrC [Opitutae bacterium]|nr:excinuclease ABC subunit UvrC [Opitutae bacterium]